MDPNFANLHALWSHPKMRAAVFRTQALPQSLGLVSTPFTHMAETAALGAYIAEGIGLDVGSVFLAGAAHDIGKGPFGHFGEAILKSHSGGSFSHSTAGAALLNKLESELGLDFGEEVKNAVAVHSTRIDSPRLHTVSPVAQVTIYADTIAHCIGDTLDTIETGLLGPASLLPSVLRVLGDDPINWANNLAIDLIANSEKGRISLSKTHFKALVDQTDWLLKYVYEPVANSPWALARRKYLSAVLRDFSYSGDRTGSLSDRIDAVSEVASLTDDEVIALFERNAPEHFYPDEESNSRIAEFVALNEASHD